MNLIKFKVHSRLCVKAASLTTQLSYSNGVTSTLTLLIKYERVHNIPDKQNGYNSIRLHTRVI